MIIPVSPIPIDPPPIISSSSINDRECSASRSSGRYRFTYVQPRNVVCPGKISSCSFNQIDVPAIETTDGSMIVVGLEIASKSMKLNEIRRN